MFRKEREDIMKKLLSLTGTVSLALLAMFALAACDWFMPQTPATTNTNNLLTLTKAWYDGSKVDVTWSGSGSSFTVYRSTTKTGTYTKLGTASASPYADTSFSPGTLYFYAVTATNKSSISITATDGAVYVWPVYVTPGYVSPYSLIPMNDLYAATFSNYIYMQWSGSASNYYVYRSTSKLGDYSQIASTDGLTYFQDSMSSTYGTSANTVYYYVITDTDYGATITITESEYYGYVWAGFFPLT